jgi:hypothetical protein
VRARLTAALVLLALVAVVALLRPSVAVVTYQRSPARGAALLAEYEPTRRIIVGVDPVLTKRRRLSELACANINLIPLDASVYGVWRGLPSFGRGAGDGDCGIRPDDRPWAGVSWRL